MTPILACLISGGCGLLLAGQLLDGPAPAGGPARPAVAHHTTPGGPAAKQPAAPLFTSPFLFYANDNAR